MNTLVRVRIFLTKALIFIAPLFFLPYTTEHFDINKQILFWLIVPVLALLRIVESVREGFTGVKKNIIDLLVLAYAISALFSALLGLHTHTSIFGSFGIPGDSFLNIMNFAVFYLVISGMRRDRESVKQYLDVLLHSFAAILVLAALNLAGFFADMAWAGVALRSLLFFVSGSTGSFFVFCAVMLALLTGLMLFSKVDDYKSKVYHLLLWLAALSLLVLSGNQAAWITAIFGTLAGSLFFYLGSDIAHSPKINLIIPAVLILAVLGGYSVSAMKIFTAPKIIGELDRPSLNFSDAWTISRNSIRANLFFGNGPGTFDLVFSKYRPSSMNYGENWNYRFDKLPSRIMDLAASQGLLGIIFYLALLAAFFTGIFRLLKGKWGEISPENKTMIYPLLAGLAAAVAAAALSGYFFALDFLFWLFLGMLMFFQKEQSASAAKYYRLIPAPKEDSRSGGLIYRILLAVLAAFFAGWLYSDVAAVSYWYADTVYNGSPNDIRAVLKAAAIDPGRSEYGLRLSKLFLEKSKQELSSGNRQDEVAIKGTIDQAVGWAEQAAAANINSVAARENLGILYRDFAPYVDNSESIALIHFKRAKDMEPSNPVLPAEIGKLYLKQKEAENAVAYIQEALDLKSDYAEAQFYLAKAYGELGKDSEALSIFTSLSSRYNDPEIFFEMGRIYYNQKDLEQAEEAFQRVLALVPSHANSFYGLALIYESEGDIEQAIKYYNRVLELNPANEEILSKIKSLTKQ